jgi:hypothetical protein
LGAFERGFFCGQKDRLSMTTGDLPSEATKLSRRGAAPTIGQVPDVHPRRPRKYKHVLEYLFRRFVEAA